MLPNELYTVTKEEFEKLFSDPRNQLQALNLEITFVNSYISVLMTELDSLEKRRKEVINTLLNDVN